MVTFREIFGPVEECLLCGSSNIAVDKEFTDRFYICYDCNDCQKMFEVRRKEPLSD